ncbi:hypothetical protein [Cellulomonas massiliensis]|uniref:hypothetical protein n=1 Tax=Cellulomonas massiliensis TaxID=1465811 RepID=UPI0002D44B93|nr:hypothetical protein [Cellulomonas massiliensis]
MVPQEEPPSPYVAGILDDRDAVVAHRPWSTLLLLAHAVVTAAGAAGLVVAIVLAATAMRPPADPDAIHEPYGLVIGALLGVAGLVAVGLGAGLWVAAAAARRSADAGSSGSLRVLAIVALVLAGVVAAALVTAGGLLGLPLALVVCGPYAACAVRLLRATSTAPDRWPGALAR